MKLSSRFAHISDPTVANLLKLTENPDIISFSGGTPSLNTLLSKLAQEAVAHIDPNLQYSPTQGTKHFRQTLATYYSAKWQTTITPDQILITTGSQQALDLIARTYLDPQDAVLVENPTYFVALYSFNAYTTNYKIVKWNNDKWPNTKLAYFVPTFQNPTGKTLDQNQRHQVAQQASLIVEDDPYSELYFSAPPPPPIHTIAPTKTIYVTSLSKIIGPAMRTGIIISSPEIIANLTRAKVGLDLCTSGWLQQTANYIYTHPTFASHLASTRAYYAHQSTLMESALTKYMPPSVTWTQPAGGLFVWLTLPPSVDTARLFDLAITHKVAFVPGYIFDPFKRASSSLRLSFAIATPDQIDQGIQVLGQLIDKTLNKPLK